MWTGGVPGPGERLRRRMRRLRERPEAFVLPWLLALGALLAVLALMPSPRHVFSPQAYASTAVRIVNSTNRTVVVVSSVAGVPQSGIGRTVRARSSIQANEAYLALSSRATLEFLDPETCASLGSVVMSSGGTVEFAGSGGPRIVSGVAPSPAAGLDREYAITTRLCANRVALRGEPWRHAGSVLAEGDGRPWLIAPDGSLGRISMGGEEMAGVAYLPNGGLVAGRATPGSTSPNVSLWVTDRRGSSWREIVRDAGRPMPSPDGTRVAYLRYEGLGAYELGVVGVDGASEISLGGSVRDIAWAPDSHRLAVVVAGPAPDDACRLEIWGLDGTKRNVHDGIDVGLDDYETVEWSPRGDRLAVFGVDAAGTRKRLLILDETGAERRVIELGTPGIRTTEQPEGDRKYDKLAEPAFSPDGSKLAFLRVTYPYAESAELDELYVTDVDGGSAVFVADGVATVRPVWSPDAAWLLYATAPDVDDPNGALFAVRPDGSDFGIVADGLTPIAWAAE